MAQQGQEPSTSTAPQQCEENENKNPVTEAWKDLVERISVAGWKEALSEEVPQIRRTFQITLLVLSILSVYYSALVITQWIKSGYKDEIQDIYDLKQLPFTNVTICAEASLNQTFVQKNIYIPENQLLKYTSETGLSIDELYRQLTLYLSAIVRPRLLDPKLSALFSQVVRRNQRLEDYSAFMDAAAVRCQSMFRKCWFSQVEFDCCKMAIRSIDEDGICYILALNMDSDNAHPLSSTYQQTRSGPVGGLTMEVSLPLDEFTWLEDDTDNGFRVYISPVPYSIIQSPLGAPSGAETFIKVVPAKRHLSVNCADYGQLGWDHEQGQHVAYYDPDGFRCMLEAMAKMVMQYMSCLPPAYTYRPNASTVCGPAAFHIVESMVSRADAEKLLQSLADNIPGASAQRLWETLGQFQEGLRKAMSETSRCKKHCVRWTYDSSSSFVNLEQPESGEKNRMFSRIHVYYGDLSYREYVEVREYTTYLAFCDLGNVVGLYWGMSIVSFLHVLYYLPRYGITRYRYMED